MSFFLGTIILFSIVMLSLARRPRAVVATKSEVQGTPRSLNQEERLRLALLSKRRGEESTKPIYL